VGGPLDGRMLGLATGMTGQSPRVYGVPVPKPGGGQPLVHVYHREPNPGGREERRTRFVFVYDLEGRRPDRPRWPWSRPAARS
jgi:hypothetical protein